MLLEHQLSQGRHMHWEQPGRSIMFQTPLLKSLFEKTLAATFDLCNLGELKDPQNQKLIKKSMVVRTTSFELFRQLHGFVCNRNHVHQSLAGSCKHKRDWVTGTSFSENYPRKFARYVAKILAKLKWPRENPCSVISSAASSQKADLGTQHH